MNTLSFLAATQAVLPTVAVPGGAKGWVLSQHADAKLLCVLLVSGPCAGESVQLTYDSVQLATDFVAVVRGR